MEPSETQQGPEPRAAGVHAIEAMLPAAAPTSRDLHVNDQRSSVGTIRSESWQGSPNETIERFEDSLLVPFVCSAYAPCGGSAFKKSRSRSMPWQEGTCSISQLCPHVLDTDPLHPGGKQ